MMYERRGALVAAGRVLTVLLWADRHRRAGRPTGLAGIVAVPVVIVGEQRYNAAVRADMRERT